MWIYEKKLQYPVKIKTPNPRLAQIIIPSSADRTARSAPPCATSISATPCRKSRSRVC